MLGEFSRQHETNSRLNLATAQSSLLTERRKTTGLSGNTIKDIVNEGVHDGHALLGDTRIGMDLLENAVNVSRPRFGTLLVALGSRSLLGCLLGRLFGRSLGHFDDEYCVRVVKKV